MLFFSRMAQISSKYFKLLECGIVKLLNETLDQRHYKLMSDF